MRKKFALALCALMLSAAPVGAYTLSRDAGGVRTITTPNEEQTPAVMPSPRPLPPACGPAFCVVSSPPPLCYPNDCAAPPEDPPPPLPLVATPNPLPDRRP
jgi:hypothetical protein